MSKIEFEDKVDTRQTDLPRKNYIGAADINEVKSAVNNVALLTHEVTLTKAQLNTINDEGGIAIPLSDFGCKSGEDIQMYSEYPTAEIFRDGVDFNSVNRSILLFKDSFNVSSISRDVIQSEFDGKYGSVISVPRPHLYSTSPLMLTCEENITGGGANAFIKIKFFYQIVKI